MFTCKETESSLNRVLAGLVVVVAVVMGALTHVMASIQPVV
jgi:hypothetical protein